MTSSAQPSGVRAEVAALVRLGWPLALAQLSNLAMGIVDTAMATRLGTTAVGALGIANALLWATVIVGLSGASGLDPHLGRARGAGQPRRFAGLLAVGTRLALLAAVPLAGTLVLFAARFEWFGQDPSLDTLARRYLLLSAPGVFPMLVFAAMRSAATALDEPRAVLEASLVANGLNVALNVWLIRGGLGVPALGVVGLALGSTLSRFALPVVLWWRLRRSAEVRAWLDGRPPAGVAAPTGGADAAPRALDAARAILRTALPIGAQAGLETAGFSLTTIWMGQLGVAALAAHQVALQLIAFLYQLPFAIGAAAAIRIGQGLGRHAADPRRARDATAFTGWTSFGAGVVVAVGIAAALWLGRRPVAALAFAPAISPAAYAQVVVLLEVAVFFQIADALQAVGFGVLRGLDDTRVPTLFNIVGFLCIGLPVARWGAFHAGHGPPALWWGLFAALSAVAVLLVWRFAGFVRGPRLRSLS